MGVVKEYPSPVHRGCCVINESKINGLVFVHGLRLLKYNYSSSFFLTLMFVFFFFVLDDDLLLIYAFPIITHVTATLVRCGCKIIVWLVRIVFRDNQSNQSIEIASFF